MALAGTAPVALADRAAAQQAPAPVQLFRPQFGPPKKLTPDVVAKACQADNQAFCPLEKGGTQADVACLQQHHINLHLTCRNVLKAARPATTPIVRLGLS